MHLKSIMIFIALALLLVAGCESGTNKVTPKDTEVNSDSDLLLGDEDGLLGDEDGLIPDETEDDGTADGDKLGKDDGMAGDEDSVLPDADAVPETCGNTMVDEGEICDGNVIDCVTIDPLLYSGGKASCLDTCLGWDTVTCDEIPHTCGNDIVEGPELCDGNLKDCVDIDDTLYSGGKATCNGDCDGWDTATCDEIVHECGNDVVEGPEICDTAGLTDCVEIDPTKYSAGKAYCLEDCSGYDTVTCEEIVVDEDTAADDDIVPDTADVQPDVDTVDDWVPDMVDVQPDPDTADIDTQPDPDTVDVDSAEADVLPDNDTAVPCGSVRLDGSNGYIEVAHNALLNLTGNWTLEAWVNQDTIPTQAAIIRKGGTTATPGYYLYGTYNQLFTDSAPYGGYYTDASNYYSNTATLTPGAGEWYHIALVKNGTELTMFINGTADAATTAAGDTYANTESLFFGSRQSGPTYFDGLIDEIRISSVARYTTSFTPQERFTSDANTIGLWHFEETSGTVADNAAGTALNGTLVGGVTWEASCAADGTVVTPDVDVMPDVDTVTPVIDTIGTAETAFSGSSRMRGDFYSCTTARTLTEIEQYLSYSGTATIYYEVYESTTLDGTYYPVVSVPQGQTMAGEGFYSSGTISVPLQSGYYYYIGARWDASYTVGYYNNYTATLYTTAFGQWQSGMTYDSITTAPASVTYSGNSNANYAYYQRLTTTE